MITALSQKILSAGTYTNPAKISGLLSAFGDQNPVSQIVNDIVTWLPKGFVANVIIIVAAAVANAVKDVMGAALSGLSYGVCSSRSSASSSSRSV